MAKILIVDDEELDRVFLSRVLEDAGHELRFAPNGRVALRLYEKDEADLIVTDIMMPELNGLQLIQQIKERDPWARIIAITGSDPARLAQAEELGAVAVLSKPLAIEKLLEAIDQGLDGHGHWRDIEL